jgi:hypothetical protein
MLRRASFLALWAIFLVAACQDPVSTDGPSRDVLTPSFSAAQNWDRGYFTRDVTAYVACLGQNVAFHVDIPYAIHTVISQSGIVNIHMRYGSPNPNTPMTYGIAEVSGTVYEWRGNPILYTMHLAKGEVHQYQDVETYVAENGDWIKLIKSFHVTVNANGEVAVERGLGMEYFECSND